jgi:hypothetical protein
VSKTINKVVIEITKKELEEKGFDKIWDDIRSVYSSEDYKTDKIKNDNKKKTTTVILERKTILSEID